jgi:hypothetical protein
VTVGRNVTLEKENHNLVRNPYRTRYQDSWSVSRGRHHCILTAERH